MSGTRRRLALSVPRQWVDRSEREVSGIVLEVATALGRMPHAATGESTAPRLSDGDVPTAARLRQLYLDPGRACRQRGASAWPVSPRAELTHLPQPQGEALAVPPEWLRCPARGLDRILSVWRARLAPELSAADGIVAEVWSGVTPPGVRPERPLSASALGLLLACPHRFLLERILHLGEPASRPPTDSIEPVAYGALFHAAAERFFREAGAQVCAHDGDVAVHTARAHALAAEQFEQLRDEYPLRGSDAIERERRRLLRQIEHLVHDEWQRPARAYVDSERSFGDPVPVRLAVDDGALFVRGAIDRLDRLSSGGVSVRDLKTGRVRDFREEPLNAARDLQIGLYTLALEAPEGDAPGTPVVEAAYVHPSLTQEPDRAFRGPDLDLLRRETGRWLGVAQRLLSVGAFPRTPHAEDCRFCPFLPACGDQAQAQSAAKLRRATAREEIGSFVRFKEESRHDDG